MTPYENDILLATQANLPWELLEGSSVLVAGATGLIGSCLVDVLMEAIKTHNLHTTVYAMARDKEKGLVRFASYLSLDNFHFLRHDVTQPLEGDLHFDYIIHAASSASPQLYSEKPVEVMKANFIGVSNLIEYGIHHHMRRFLFISSGEVYGQQQAEWLDENHYGYVDLLNSRSCYPSSKRAAETLAACYAAEYNADIVIARPCHTFGPHFQASDQRAYAQFIRNAEAGQGILLKSDGSQYRSWCYVVDCAVAILFVLLKGERGKAYNVADRNCESSLRHLAETIARLCRVPLSVGAPDSTAGQRVIFDTSLIEGLGWKTEGTLDDKLRHSLETRLIERNEKED